MNDENCVNLPIEEIARRYYATVPLARPLDGHEAPVSNRKAKEMLGFSEAHPWRLYVRT